MQDEARELKSATCDGNVLKVEKMINEDGIDINSAIWVSINFVNSGCVKVTIQFCKFISLVDLWPKFGY